MPPNYRFEIAIYTQGFQKIAGVDEVGRGCLAGPVVASAVILPKNCDLVGLNDSKVLTPVRREKLSAEIYRVAEGVGIGMCSPQDIDEMNIAQASFLAMKKAIFMLNPAPDYLLIDGPFKLDLPLPQQGITKGDALSCSIAAASIVAKVFRDRLMDEYAKRFPHYQFDQNKGYPTKDHKEAIQRFGVTEIHRFSFRGVGECARA